MNATAWALLAAAGAIAAGNWIAVAPNVRAKRAEYVLKPATMLALIGVAVTLTPQHAAQRAAFFVGLVLSLAGDVFLMLPTDAFVAGLTSFFLAHVAYVVGFAVGGVSAGWAAVGGVLVVVAGAVLGRRIVRAVRERHPELAVPVTAYMTVISAMVVLAVSSTEPVAAVGALLFYCSDALIAWDRFVSQKAWARPAIMVTYHLAQAGLVVSLAL